MIDEHGFQGENAFGQCTSCGMVLGEHAPEGGFPSWAPQVLVDGEWSGNALRFGTQKEAADWAKQLLYRWFVPTDSRAVGSMDSPNYILLEGGLLQEIKKEVVN